MRPLNNVLCRGRLIEPLRQFVATEWLNCSNQQQAWRIWRCSDSMKAWAGIIQVAPFYQRRASLLPIWDVDIFGSIEQVCSDDMVATVRKRALQTMAPGHHIPFEMANDHIHCIRWPLITGYHLRWPLIIMHRLRWPFIVTYRSRDGHWSSYIVWDSHTSLHIAPEIDIGHHISFEIAIHRYISFPTWHWSSYIVWDGYW